MSDLFSSTDLALLILRIGTGVIFIPHGYPKMTGGGGEEKGGQAHLTQSLAKMGLPFPYAFAILVGAIEFFGGLLLILGLQTQWAALALAFVMLVATGRVLVQRGFVGEADFPFSLLVATLALALLGGGTISLEQIVLAVR
ncbi:MAG: DoxX family protein [Deltaproteobacteria bacterium]|nr:DoxX family protein [Deltaproteobacteria bacterium]MDZ4344665.1 DoxX family protein [Candidatus Binatia bacterium]